MNLPQRIRQGSFVDGGDRAGRLYRWGMLDANRLRVFRAVVASGSVGAAATHLGYTPSAISQQIGALQRETGLTLFERSGRGITPTAAGRVLAAESDDAMSALARLSTLVDDLRDGRSMGLSIGCFSSVGQMWMPRVAKVLGQEFPDALVTLYLNEIPDPSSSYRPEIDVRAEEVDATPRRLPGYSRQLLHGEGYHLVMPRDHILAELDEIPLAKTAGQAWINSERADSTCGRIVSQAFRAVGVTPRWVARCEDHYTATALVAAGVGVAMLPQLALVRAPSDVVCRPIVDPQPRRNIVAYVRDGAESSPVAARALELLHHAAAAEARDERPA